MKNCPFCNAVLTDEANFCLYCMTSLDEKKISAPLKKKKRKAFPIILLFTVILLSSVLAFFIITEYKVDNNNQISEHSLNNGEDASDESPVYPRISYTYRTAVIGDDYSSAYIPDENDIIITGIENPEPSGIYYVPNSIDGKRVLGIDPLAFSDKKLCETVKKVIISDKIKTVWENAFASCVNMSDIYLAGESIYIDAAAFPQKRNGALAIHCSDTCNDRNFRLYKNNAEIYGAVYEYWDGGDLSL